MAMAADPHMLLAAASLVPGLGSLAAAMDMALYLYEGDSFNAALAAAALIPGGAMLAIGVGKGARALFNLARSGAKDLGAAVKASRVFRGLAGAGGAVSRVVGSVRTRISKWVGKADDVGRDVGKLAESHITNSGETVLGHYPGYIEKAQSRGASYFDIGDTWNTLSPTERWQLNTQFLDTRIAARDRVLLSVPKSEIRPGRVLVDEIKYLQDNGYRWVNQWSLHPPK